MAKGKVPKKRITSPDIQNKLAAFLEHEGERLGIPVYVDNPPAERYGKSGRPDLFIDWGHVHFRIEIKARADEKPSDNQQSYQRRDGQHHFGRTFTLGGMAQCDYFIANFHAYMAMLLAVGQRAQSRMVRHMQALSPTTSPDFQFPQIMENVEYEAGSLHMVNEARVMMSESGFGYMWDSKHIEPDDEALDEMDEPT